ncbi:hypothetical protein BH10PSE19_BH10PSE19_19690 [soil metagenome]
MRNKIERMKLTIGLFVVICLLPMSVLAHTETDAGNTAKLPITINGVKTMNSNEKSTDMTKEQVMRNLRAANEVAKEMKRFGHHPFGAVLVAPDNETILLRYGNISVVRHAETDLARWAAEIYSPEYLAKCTLVTTMEPCVMCAGAIYFANIGKVVFGVTEDTLKKLTGSSKMNPTMHLPCRQVFDAGQKRIQVIGPIPDMEKELIEPHKSFWK